MYKKDYILTMIEQLSQFLGRLIFLKETRRFDIALAEIDEFSGRMFERTIRELRMMTAGEILAFAREGDDMRRRVALGTILKELGDIAALNDDAEGAIDLYGKGLGVLLDAYGDGSRALPLETPERIELLLECVAGYDLPREVGLLLFGYLEVQGFYAEAEDLLFDLLDSRSPEMLDTGIGFYERLLLKDDADLENGNLPRQEVEDSLRELRSGRG